MNTDQSPHTVSTDLFTQPEMSLSSGRHRKDHRYRIDLHQNDDGMWFYDLIETKSGDRYFYDIKEDFEGFETPELAVAHAMETINRLA